MDLTFALVSALLYLTAAALLVKRLRAGPSAGHLSSVVPAGTGAAVVLHAVTLYATLSGSQGMALGFFEAVSLTAWAAALVLVLASLRGPVIDLGIFALPLAAAAVLAGVLFPAGHPASGHRSAPVDLHIVVSVIAYGLLTIAAFQAIMLAYQERRLSRHKPSGILGLLPALQVQEHLMFQFIAAGFFLLTLSLVTGLVFVQDVFAQHLVHKTVLSIIAWLVFGVLLWGRWRYGWRGRTAVRWSLAGFVTLAVAYFGTKLVLELILHRYWYS